jgi:hypothetical protein
VRVCDGPPLLLPHEGSTPVKPGVDLLENADSGAVFLWGNAAWFWTDGDVTGRRLAAVGGPDSRGVAAAGRRCVWGQ